MFCADFRFVADLAHDLLNAVLRAAQLAYAFVVSQPHVVRNVARHLHALQPRFCAAYRYRLRSVDSGRPRAIIRLHL